MTLLWSTDRNWQWHYNKTTLKDWGIFYYMYTNNININYVKTVSWFWDVDLHQFPLHIFRCSIGSNMKIFITIKFHWHAHLYCKLENKINFPTFHLGTGRSQACLLKHNRGNLARGSLTSTTLPSCKFRIKIKMKL